MSWRMRGGGGCRGAGGGEGGRDIGRGPPASAFSSAFSSKLLNMHKIQTLHSSTPMENESIHNTEGGTCTGPTSTDKGKPCSLSHRRRRFRPPSLHCHPWAPRRPLPSWTTSSAGAGAMAAATAKGSTGLGRGRKFWMEVEPARTQHAIFHVVDSDSWREGF